MAQRMTPSQYNAHIRRLQNQQKQEIDRINRANRQAVDNHNREVRRYNNALNNEIRRYNQNARAAVSKYNQAVLLHNAKVNVDRQKLERQINALRNRPILTHYADVRTSTYSLHERLGLIGNEKSTSPEYAELIALSERESSNSIGVMDTLLEEAPNEHIQQIDDSGIIEYLEGFSEDLCNRWKGAVFALNPANPDAARHFCTSVREIFTEILEEWAYDNDVIDADANCQRTPQGKPSRRSKIHYLLNRKNINSSELVSFVEADIDNIVDLFNVFNEATHGVAGKHSFSKLKAIRERVEGGIMFLAAVAA